MNKKQQSDLQADIAVMLVLRAFGIKAGGVLEHGRLVANWPEYGLQQGELRTALARLLLRGHLRMVARPDVDQVMLTERGAQWARALPAWLEYQLIVPSRSAYQARRMLGLGVPRPAAGPIVAAAGKGYAVAA